MEKKKKKNIKKITLIFEWIKAKTPPDKKVIFNLLYFYKSTRIEKKMIVFNLFQKKFPLKFRRCLGQM